ncbi:DUF5361 domain-containing protein [Nocardia sp. NPDC057668]|uniref:DUF5361 domain-containing protein n=1 Tax=Nocardia sp. NPDC057668 TaxID=3346202 RepID=UPI003670095C
MDSALGRQTHPDQSQWQLTQMLMADMADSLRWLVWSKTEEAQQNRNRPEPIPRPGLKASAERIGSAVSTAELDNLLGWG